MKTIIYCAAKLPYSSLEFALSKIPWVPTEVIVASTRGTSLLAIQWAYRNKVQVKNFTGTSTKHTKETDLIRDKKMVAYAEAILVLSSGKVRKTLAYTTLAYSSKRKKHVRVFEFSKKSLTDDTDYAINNEMQTSKEMQ